MYEQYIPHSLHFNLCSELQLALLQDGGLPTAAAATAAAVAAAAGAECRVWAIRAVLESRRRRRSSSTMRLVNLGNYRKAV